MPTPKPLRLLLLKLALWACLFFGCNISPQPEPPAEVLPELPDLSSSQVEIISVDNGLVVRGGPGAVVNGDSLRAYNLDRVAVRGDTQVAADGSFELQLSGAAGNRLRLQVRGSEGGSRPFDLTGEGFARPVTTPLADCFVFVPDLEVDFNRVPLGEMEISRVRMQNNCANDVVMFEIGVLVGEPAFSYIVPSNPVIEPGTSQMFGIAFSPAEMNEAEDILILTFNNGTEHRAVTIRGRGQR